MKDNSTTIAYLAALRPFSQFSPLMEGLAAAHGYPTYEAFAKSADSGIAAWWIEPADEVFTSWTATERYLTLFQLATSGQRFTLHVPIARLRRIAEEITPDGSRRLTIEIDADREVIEISGKLNVDGGAALNATKLSASYTLTATPGLTADLDRFARELRRL